MTHSIDGSSRHTSFPAHPDVDANCGNAAWKTKQCATSQRNGKNPWRIGSTHGAVDALAVRGGTRPPARISHVRLAARPLPHEPLRVQCAHRLVRRPCPARVTLNPLSIRAPSTLDSVFELVAMNAIAMSECEQDILTPRVWMDSAATTPPQCTSAHRLKHSL